MRDSAAFDGLIADASRRWGAAYGVQVPPSLVKGLIAQESQFDPSATRVEDDGRVSRGLMQMLDDTARDLGLSNPVDLYLPEVSIDLGVRYLAKQLRRYQGDVGRALSAYNAGTATTANQSYVAKVLAYARSFGYVAGAGAALLLALGAVVFLASRRRRVA